MIGLRALDSTRNGQIEAESATVITFSIPRSRHWSSEDAGSYSMRFPFKQLTLAAGATVIVGPLFVVVVRNDLVCRAQL